MRTLIQNGTIVTSTEQFKSDILISDGKITKIDKHISAKGIEKVINADNKLIFPGGIDPHVHFHLPTPAGFSSDDFLSGGIAALYGGTTTIIDFVTPKKGQSLLDALNERIKEAKNCPIDYSFHISPVDWRLSSEQEIQECVNLGFPSFKIYLAYKDSIGLDDEVIFKVMKAVRNSGGLVTAHCEMGDEIDVNRDAFYEKQLITPRDHMLSRPARMESSAVKRAVDMADQTNCPLYIVHVSAGESIKYIHMAQQSGQKVYAETCPQYLLLDESAYIGTFEQTAKYVISPPLRTIEDSAALWEGIQKSIIQTVGTDHCPFSFKQKSEGINDFRKIPNGAGGVEHRLTLLYTYGVLKDIISMNKLVDIFSTQPAKIFGLYPQKGEIAVGSDADLVIWDPNFDSKISANTHHSKADQSIYEGFNVKGRAKYVISGGNILVDNGILTKNLPIGDLIHRMVQIDNSTVVKSSSNEDRLSNNCGRV